jgi:maleamate amidohydrolase
MTEPRIWDDVIGPAERAEYEKAGWGGRVGFGERPALIVVDMYRAFVDPAYPFAAANARETVEPIARLIAAFRASGRPVFFSTGKVEPLTAARGRWKVRATTDSPLMLSPAAYEIWPALEPRVDESVVVKTYPSAFFGTTLASQLVYHQVDTLVVVGTVTSGCVRGTCLDAFNFNYRVIVPEECVCDRGDVSHKVALFEIHMKYGDVVPLADVLEHVESRALA